MPDAATLVACPLFAPLPPRVIASLAPRFHEQTLAAGQTLYTAGDPADCFLAVHKGALSVEHPERGTHTLESGAFMGVANLLEPSLHDSTVRALSDTLYSTFDRQDLDRLWRENPAGAAFFHLALANRLITLLRRANERLVKLCELPLDRLDHEGLRRALKVVDDALDNYTEDRVSGRAPP